MKCARWAAALLVAAALAGGTTGCKDKCSNSTQANGPGKTFISTNCS